MLPFIPPGWAWCHLTSSLTDRHVAIERQVWLTGTLLVMPPVYVYGLACCHLMSLAHCHSCLPPPPPPVNICWPALWHLTSSLTDRHVAIHTSWTGMVPFNIQSDWPAWCHLMSSLTDRQVAIHNPACSCLCTGMLPFNIQSDWPAHCHSCLLFMSMDRHVAIERQVWLTGTLLVMPPVHVYGLACCHLMSLAHCHSCPPPPTL